MQGDVHGLEAGASFLCRLLLNFCDALKQHLRLGEEVNPQVLLHPEEAVVVPGLNDVAHVGRLHGVIRLFDLFLPFLLLVGWQQELCVVQNWAVRWSTEDEVAENFRLLGAKKRFVDLTFEFALKESYISLISSWSSLRFSCSTNDFFSDSVLSPSRTSCCRQSLIVETSSRGTCKWPTSKSWNFFKNSS